MRCWQINMRRTNRERKCRPSTILLSNNERGIQMQASFWFSFRETVGRGGSGSGEHFFLGECTVKASPPELHTYGRRLAKLLWLRATVRFRSNWIFHFRFRTIKTSNTSPGPVYSSPWKRRNDIKLIRVKLNLSKTCVCSTTPEKISRCTCIVPHATVFGR